MDLKFELQKVKERQAYNIVSKPFTAEHPFYESVWSNLSEEANLVAIYLPGFGRSEGGYEYMSFSAQSAFLENFLKDQNLNNVHIVAPDIAMPVALH